MNSQEAMESNFMFACANGDLERVKGMLANGDGYLGMNFLGISPLIVACRREQYEVAKFLIESGADVNLEAIDGSALVHADECRSSRCVKLLIDSGADVSRRNQFADRFSLPGTAQIRRIVAEFYDIKE
jgi:ankyrin repeat protein